MQLPAPIDDLLEMLLTPPLLYVFLLLVIVLIVGAVAKARSGAPKDSTMKQIHKLRSAVEKEKEPPTIEVESRQNIIGKIFEEQMTSIGMTPSDDSGYIPTSQTQLAKYLKKYNISDEIVDAIQAGLDEVKSEAEVRSIIRATADTKDVNLEGIFLEKAEEIAIEEWKRRKGIAPSQKAE